MSQFKYDVVEFILNNKDEIKAHLQITLPSKTIFKGYEDLYDSLVLESQISALIEFLNDHFPNSIEDIYLIFDEQFINIVKQELIK